jgi:hypothetical protein
MTYVSSVSALAGILLEYNIVPFAHREAHPPRAFFSASPYYSLQRRFRLQNLARSLQSIIQ